MAADAGGARRSAAALAPGAFPPRRSERTHDPGGARGRVWRHVAFRALFAAACVARRQGHCQCPGAADPIMRTVPGVAAIHDPDDPPPFHHFYCPFFSLPRAFETTPDSIPASLPWLHADPALAERWNARLPEGKVRVGLVWAGQARPMLPGFATLDGRRSMALATLAQLAAVSGCELYQPATRSGGCAGSHAAARDDAVRSNGGR